MISDLSTQSKKTKQSNLVSLHHHPNRTARYVIYLCVIVLLFAQTFAQPSTLQPSELTADPPDPTQQYSSDYEELIFCNHTDVHKIIYCSNDEQYKEQESDHGWRLVLDLVMSGFIVCFAGLMSGLTIGLMSLDTTNLQIVMRSGTPTAQKYAAKILPLVKKHHLLLVTLLVANSIAMETLPLFLDRIVGPVLAILISVTMVLLFGEIIPQSLCTRYGLAIGANLAWLVWILIAVFFVISYPVSKLLDCLLGSESGTFYRRAELKELVNIHEATEDTMMDDRLTQDEVSIIKGAIDLRSKTVAVAMTPIDRVSMLGFDDILDISMRERLVQEGHSRWPVYRNERNNIIGMLLVKTLIDFDPSDSVPVRDLPLFRFPVVHETMPLYQVLRMFQLGKSHMAIVIDSVDCITTRGVITLEDIVEELIGKEILDEAEVFNTLAKQARVTRAFRRASAAVTR